jgi:GH25 family lysozyme M1 (1,4-beta-N-acetylmuramidase)
LKNTPGVDVKRYEGDIDWKKVAAAGNRFVVMRATVGDYYTDPRFYSYWSGAKDAGLLVGVFHVVMSNIYGSKQMDRLYSVLGDRKPDFPIVLDVEVDTNVSIAANTACIQDCIRESAKYDPRKPIIYTAFYYWRDHVQRSTDWAKYDLWVASYDPKPFLPPDWTNWKFWQYTPNGKVDGITGSADQDWFQGSYPDLVNYAGQVPTPTPEPVSGLRARVIVTVLNIRSGPALSYKNLGTLSINTVLSAINLGGQDLWVESDTGKWSACNYGGKQYMQLLPGDKPADGIKAKVLFDHLNIRSGPATSYEVIGKLNTGDMINIVGIGGKDAWIEYDLGKWAAFSYSTGKYMEIVT